ncbi:MAG: glycosyltransferase family 2 protein [Planctomycetaceae bacterium]|nr:glycosyltransferase family 2 protein [Planctomycetaceae bacterium]
MRDVVNQITEGYQKPGVSSREKPVLSVVIPVRNDPEHLRSCLSCLKESRFESFEVIVVDDASTDDTAAVAKDLGAKVISLASQSGPAKARNRGATEATGEYVFFLDADVLVNSETIRLIVEEFRGDPTIDAVFGSYDLNPGKQNILSQYKNLFHHFVHQNSRREATTFWSGCGAIKRQTFLDIGGFDTSYARPCIEDIELGARLHRRGHRICLLKHVQVTHLKHWSLWTLMKTDVWDRAVPWTQLMLRDGNIPNDLNVGFSQRLSALFTCCLLVMLAISALLRPELILFPVLTVVVILLMDAWSINRRIPGIVRVGASALALVIATLLTIRFHYWSIAPWLAILGILILNWRFYLFFSREKQPLFAAIVFPLHFIYFSYCSATFAAVSWCHLWRRSLFLKLVLVTGVMVSGAALGEIYVRYLIAFDRREPILISDATMGWKSRPSLRQIQRNVRGRDLVVDVDEKGRRVFAADYRERDVAAVDPVFLFGDELVWGTDVDNDEVVSSKLAGQISNPVFNYGVIGFGTDQELLLMESVFGEDSSRGGHVVVLVNPGDFSNVQQNKNYFLGRTKPVFHVSQVGMTREPYGPNLREQVMDVSRLVWLLNSKLNTWFQPHEPEASAGLETVIACLDEMRLLAESGGRKFHLLAVNTRQSSAGELPLWWQEFVRRTEALDVTSRMWNAETETFFTGREFSQQLAQAIGEQVDGDSGDAATESNSSP